MAYGSRFWKWAAFSKRVPHGKADSFERAVLERCYWEGNEVRRVFYRAVKRSVPLLQVHCGCFFSWQH